MSLKSLHAIDSILSLDDTILRDIKEDDNNDNENEIFTVSPNIHEKTLNSFAHGWNTCDSLLEGHEHVNNGADVLMNNRNSVNTTNDNSEDNTLLNAPFTQWDYSDTKDDIPNNSLQVIDSYIIMIVIYL